MTGSSPYDNLQREGLEGRELEASVLSRAAQKLARCKARWEAKKEYKEMLNEALRYNQKLWSFFQVELSNPANPLPEALRADLLRLSHFIDQKTFALFAGGDIADLDGIIRINRRIASGLLEGQRTPDESAVESQELNLTA
jgi:flagellar biosynthesis activator protein FlaF